MLTNLGTQVARLLLPALMSFHRRLHNRTSASALRDAKGRFRAHGSVRIERRRERIPIGIGGGAPILAKNDESMARRRTRRRVGRYGRGATNRFISQTTVLSPWQIKKRPSCAVPSNSARRRADAAFASNQAIILFNLKVTGSRASSRETRIAIDCAAEPRRKSPLAPSTRRRVEQFELLRRALVRRWRRHRVNGN